jgi:hypothetical protein
MNKVDFEERPLGAGGSEQSSAAPSASSPTAPTSPTDGKRPDSGV